MTVDKFGRTFNAQTKAAAAHGVSLSQANSTFLRLDGTSLAGGDIDLNSHKLVNVSDPSDPQDAATKTYVKITLVEAEKFLGMVIQCRVF